MPRYLPGGNTEFPGIAFDTFLGQAMAKADDGRVIWTKDPNGPAPLEILAFNPTTNTLTAQGVANSTVNFQVPRFATASLPAAGNAGRVAFDTTALVLVFDNGSAWVNQTGVTGSGLTNNILVLGAGSSGVKTLGSAGTTFQVLHGNAAGAPSFGQISLTTDVSGVLPSVNGGTGLNTGASSGIPSVNAGTWVINNVLTSGRVPFAGASNTLSSDALLVWDNTSKTLYVGTNDGGEVGYPNAVRVITSVSTGNLIAGNFQVASTSGTSDSGALRGVGVVTSGAANGMRAVEGQVAKTGGSSFPMYGMEIGVGSTVVGTDPNHHVGLFVQSWSGFLPGATGGVPNGTGVLVAGVDAWDYGYRYLNTVAGEIWSVNKFGIMNLSAQANSIAHVDLTSTFALGFNIHITGNGATTPGKFLRVKDGIFSIRNNANTVDILQLTDAGTATIATGLTVSGIASGSGQNCLQINTSGVITNTGSSCGSGSGSGTVTHTGNLNSSAVVLGNTGADVIGAAGLTYAAGVITVGVASTTVGKVTLLNATNANTFSIQSGVSASSLTFTLPTSDGSAGTCLSTNGAGVLAWANCSSGGTGLTSLGGQTGATQAFANVNDTNVTISVGSASNVHTFTAGWAGTLAAARGGFGADMSAASGVISFNAGARVVNNVLTSGRVLVASTSNAVASNAGFTYVSGLLQVSNSATAPVAVPTGTLLELSTLDSGPGYVMIDSYGAPTGFSAYQGRSARGSSTSPAAVQLNDQLVALTGLGFGGSFYSPSPQGSVGIYAGGTWSDVSRPTLVTFATTTSGTSSLAERMRIDDTGRVGIGTTTPATVLHVKGSGQIIRFETTSAPGGGLNWLSFDRAGTTMGFIGFTASDEGFDIGNSLAGPLRFWTNNAERVRILSGGNVGIGTIAPSQKLSVVGTVESTSGGFRFPDGTTQSTAALTGLSGSGVSGRVAFFSGASALNSNAGFTWDDTKLSFQTARTSLQTIAPMLHTSTTLSGDRTGLGSFSIPQMYGPSLGEVSYAAGLGVNIASDTSTTAAPGATNNGFSSHAILTRHNLDSGFTGYGVGISSYLTSARTSIVGVADNNDTYGFLAFVRSADTFSGGVNTVGMYSQVTVDSVFGGFKAAAKFVLSNHTNVQNNRYGIVIENGDATDTAAGSTDFTASDGVLINARTATGVNAAWLNALRVFDSIGSVDRFKIVNDGTMTMNFPSSLGSGDHVISVQRASTEVFVVSGIGNTLVASLTISGFIGGGTTAACIDGAGVVIRC